MLHMEPKDREINTPYSVYGNAAANDCLAGIDDGHVCRLIIGEGERTFVADHVRLTDGRIAMASSKGDRDLFESTEAEFGYGVAKARAYVYLPFDYSLFATDLENPRFTDAGIDPDEMVPISLAEPVTDGGQSMDETGRTADRIRTFSESIDDPEKWRVLIPVDSFDAVKRQLETTEDCGTYYDGLTLCYSQYDDEVMVEYRSALSDHDRSNGGDSE
ncbi:hypothetical protein [Natrinema sp. DC36]|uniref:hypothetical protein n=1 Tax=Natrinema sp. DC36 TaxID=2878680 RepID=UPI001CF038F6|nr:hypothetical protein [Natrinema sp. DC36]